MKKIAILYPLNSEAKERYFNSAVTMGYEPILVVGNEDDYSDVSNRIVIPGANENSFQISSILKEYGDVIAVVAAGEFAVEIAENVSRDLGLISSMTKPASILRNKSTMREEFAKYGVVQPKVYCLSSNIEELTSDCECIRDFPVVSKPVDMAGSWYVSINHDVKDILKNSKPIFAHTTAKITGLTLRCQTLVEQYICGKEYSAEVIVRDGELIDYIINKKIISDLPYFDEVGHICGVSLCEEVQNKLKSNILGIINAAGVSNSILHVEFRLADDGNIYIIEAGCRVAGDRISNIVEIKYGICLEEIMIRLKAGQAIVRPPIENNNLICIRFLFLQSPELPVGVKLIKRHIEKDSPLRQDLQPTHLVNRLGYEIIDVTNQDAISSLFI